MEPRSKTETVMTTEQEIFDALSELCSSPGYIQAFSLICLKDNVIRFHDSVSASDVQNMYSRDRLVRTEQTLITGLMIKTRVIDGTMPNEQQLQEYIDATLTTLEKLHEVIAHPLFDSIQHLHRADYDPMASGGVLREVMFYGGETVYPSQYIDLLVRKYGRDNAWLEKHKGFSIEDAANVVRAIQLNPNEESNRRHELSQLPEHQQTPLSLFSVRLSDVVTKSQLSETKVRNVLTAFSVGPFGPCNQSFNSINDFNMVSATPLIPIPENGEFFLFSFGALADAIYTSPYYWMMRDDEYRNTAANNRGRFAEEFVYERFSKVFGQTRVYKNVTISSRRHTLGEVDVLVVYCNRILVVQVKSKQLTLEARSGNDNQIRDDFKKSIQNSYDQAASCGGYLEDYESYDIRDGDRQNVDLGGGILAIYPICVVSDHYPALNSQVQKFLEFDTTEVLRPPLVVDVFILDTATEMLEYPVELLSYLKLRSDNARRMTAHDELAILSFHLKHNLVLNQEFGLIYFEDSVSMELDVAMLVRRQGLPGNDFVDGFISRLRGTTLGRILRSIENHREPDSVDLAFVLLQISEKRVMDLSDLIDKISEIAKKDRRNHDVSMYFEELDIGLTVHCNLDNITDATRFLIEHCKRRQYSKRARTWFGLCISTDGSVRFGIKLQDNWEYNAQMEKKVKELDDRGRESGRRTADVGRNDPCPCGSGKKYKHCCLP